MSDEIIFDAWTQIAFKRVLNARTTSAGAGLGWQTPTWVGLHARRLLAYTILRSYQDNAAREFMLSQSRDDIDNRREYGDPSLVVNTILGALLGESQTITVDGSEDFDSADETASQEAKDAKDLEDWLEQWADDERLGLKMIETERRAIGLGDGVYSLGWSDAKGRPRLRVWDPGFYFPVLDDDNEDDYPEKVHIAWELPSLDSMGAVIADGKRRVRRITWELGPIAPANQNAMDDGLLARLFIKPVLLDGDTIDNETSAITRQYPWNDKPSGVTCFMSDGTWTLDTGMAKVDDLTGATAVWSVDADGPMFRRDLGIDFIPVVHVPNTVALIDHYGRSSLSNVLQIFDDIAAADTDLAAAAATTGNPVLALQKSTMGETGHTYKPGQILEVGEGKMDVLDTSRSLDALLKYIEFLLKRLSVNGRLPEALLGRVSPSQVPSGLALQLSFGPLEQMVKEMRLVRNEKYPLLLKFAHRLAVAGQSPDAPQVFGLRADVQMGSFLPQDQAEAVDLVTKLLAAKPRPVISLETAVQMLIDAGFAIRDAGKEVERILERDFENASALLDATGDQALVYEYLGKPKPPKATPPPAIVIPVPAPGTSFGPDGQPLPPVTPPAPAAV